MVHFSFTERLLHKIKRILMPLFAKKHREKLEHTDFTIISNNCWGGVCYEYYGLKKNSPTVGLYFYADDYVKFVKNIRYYCGLDIRMVTAYESKHAYDLIRKHEENVPIGVLDDIEIIFLHYKNSAIAKEKWLKRIRRINWNNIVYKFSYQNECTLEHLREFNKYLPRGSKSFVFIPPGSMEGVFDNAIVIRDAEENSQILNDTFYWNKYFDVEEFLNNGNIRLRD